METLAMPATSTIQQASLDRRSRRVILLDRQSSSAAFGRASSAPDTAASASPRVMRGSGGVSTDETYTPASQFRMRHSGGIGDFCSPGVGVYQEPDWIVMQPAHASHQLTAPTRKPRVRQPGPPTPPPPRQPGPPTPPPVRRPAPEACSPPREPGVLRRAPKAQHTSPPTPPPRPRSPVARHLPGQLQEMSELSARVWPLLSKNGGSDVPLVGGHSQAAPEDRVVDSPGLINSAPSAKPLSPQPPDLGLTINCPTSCHSSVVATVTLALALAAALSYVVYDIYESKMYLYFEQ